MSLVAVGRADVRLRNCSGLAVWGDWQGYQMPVVTDGSSVLCRLWNQLCESSPRVNWVFLLSDL